LYTDKINTLKNYDTINNKFTNINFIYNKTYDDNLILKTLLPYEDILFAYNDENQLTYHFEEIDKYDTPDDPYNLQYVASGDVEETFFKNEGILLNNMIGNLPIYTCSDINNSLFSRSNVTKPIEISLNIKSKSNTIIFHTGKNGFLNHEVKIGNF
jgi:hypothetical protein